MDFLKAPLNVRSLVRREVNLPGGVLTFFVGASIPLSTLKHGTTPLSGTTEPGTVAVSLESFIADICWYLFITSYLLVNTVKNTSMCAMSYAALLDGRENHLSTMYMRFKTCTNNPLLALALDKAISIIKQLALQSTLTFANTIVYIFVQGAQYALHRRRSFAG